MGLGRQGRLVGYLVAERLWDDEWKAIAFAESQYLANLILNDFTVLDREWNTKTVVFEVPPR